jgi:hypothetical protein
MYKLDEGGAILIALGATAALTHGLIISFYVASIIKYTKSVR